MNLNKKCYGILKELEDVAEVTEYDHVRILDLGINKDAGEEAAIKVAEVTMGSLGEVRLEDTRIRVTIP
ncbi:MAG: hypothetical protein KKH78_02415, partial [Candidatus Altiarchaeota archaeon]|nr:hypothetical protein [Candidatus Altiarchaeota archaeon]